MQRGTVSKWLVREGGTEKRHRRGRSGDHADANSTRENDVFAVSRGDGICKCDIIARSLSRRASS